MSSSDLQLTVNPTPFLVSKSIHPFVVGHEKSGPLVPLHPLCRRDAIPHGDNTAKSANP